MYLAIFTCLEDRLPFGEEALVKLSPLVIILASNTRVNKTTLTLAFIIIIAG